ncbi:hypothetical protein HZA55_02530 [Candidatus Poribacteria bacterium]|nr:hypothetical protein [Candidatus Poribacteria bacterium]
MELRIIIALIGGFINLFLGILVIYKNRHNSIHRIYCFLSIVLACFNFSLFFSYAALPDPFWRRMVFMNVSVMPPISYHFFIALINKNSGIYKKIAYSGYILGLIFLISVLTPIFEVYNKIWNYSFMFVMFPYSLYGVFLLYKQYTISNQSIEKVRLKYLILGTLAIVITGGIDLIFYIHLSSIGNIFYSVLAFYSIIKHRFLDIAYLSHKFVTVLILAVLTSSIFFISFIIIGRTFIFNTIYFYVLLSVIITIIIYQPLKTKVINFIEQTIFKSKFDYQSPIYEFSNNMNNFSEENVLNEKLSAIIYGSMNFNNVAIWVRENDSYILKKTISPINSNHIISEQTDLIEAMKKHNTILKEEIERYLDYEDLSNYQTTLIKNVIERLNTLKLEAVFPIITNNYFLGFIGVSNKKNNYLLTYFDIKLLQMLAHQYAICLTNIKLQMELYKQKEMVMLGKLAGGIAHEIRNPLGAMKGAAEYLHEELKEKKLNTEFADIIIEEANRLNEQITEFLMFARPPQLEKKEININLLLSNIIKIIEKEERFKSIVFKQNLSQDLPLIKADNNQLKQVFYNLIINAGQAVESNETQGKVEISSGLNSTNIFVNIKDNGKGIQPEIYSNIFDPFFTTKEKGSGLGLSIARQIIYGHNGKISVESSPGNTSFTITLAV